MPAVSSAAKTAAAQLSKDLTHLKADRQTEARQLKAIDQKLQREVDAFVAAPTQDVKQVLSLLVDAFSLGVMKQQTQDKFDARISQETSAGRALLAAARPALTLTAFNQDREALGLKAVKKNQPPPPPTTSSGKTGKDAYDLAHSLLGKNIKDLKFNGPLVGILDKHVGNTICCANFVSACLVKEGLIKPSQHTDRTHVLAAELSKDSNWSKVSTQNMKPGDVVCFDVPGEGHYAHTELFAGYRNGKPVFIGSNNVNKDGTQRISYGHGYPIDAVFRYHG